MKKIALIFFLLAATGAFAQDLLVPESYGIYAHDGYNELILGKLLPNDKKSSPKEKTDAIWDGAYKTFYLCAPSFSEEYAFCVTEEEIVYKRAQESIWHALQKPNPSAVAVSTFTMKVTESESQQLKDLFEHATMTASFFSNRLGLDGTTYYFNSGGRLASVWSPDEGRTARLVKMADSICYAVRHQDRDVLMRQLKVCRELAHEFKQEYSISYFYPNYNFSQKTVGANDVEESWNCQLWAGMRFRFCKEYDHPIDNSTVEDDLAHYGDSIAAWNRQLFITDSQIELAVQLKESETAWCRLENGRCSLVVPERLWRREVVLSAAALPPGHYRLDENLHWQEVEE